MALSKLAIGLIAGIGSVVAVGATVTGVVVSNQNKQAAIRKEIANRTNTQLEKITTSSFTIKDEKTSNDHSKIYAFDLTKNDLVFKAELDEGYSASYEFKNPLLSAIDANSGNLVLEVKVTDTKNDFSLTKEITLTGFKKAETNLKSVLEDEKTNGGVKYSLFITPGVNQQNQTRTIEELNKQAIDSVDDEQQKPINGLTEWLSLSSIEASKKDGLYIIGQVKLERVEKQDNKTYYILTSAKSDQYLKLIKRQAGKNFEDVALSQIKTTNLEIK